MVERYCSRRLTQRLPAAPRPSAHKCDRALFVLVSASGLTLTEAASASGSVPGVWPMVTAGGRNWIDGGMISAANVQLGEGFDRVIVIAPSATSTNGFDDVEAAA